MSLGTVAWPESHKKIHLGTIDQIVTGSRVHSATARFGFLDLD